MTAVEDLERAESGATASTAGLAAWVMWDWAGQPYFTLVTTFIFFPYFAAHFIADPVRGQELLGTTLGLSGLAIALLSPVIGAIADARGRRKPWMVGFSMMFVVSCTGLWWAEPGESQRAVLIMTLIAVSNFALESATVFYNAMLPSLVPEERMGRLSGLGWGIGYVGGLVALAFVLWAFTLPGTVHSALVPSQPLWGLDDGAYEPDRMSAPFSALWYVVFAIPLFLFTPDVPSRGVTLGKAVGEGLAQLKRTLLRLRDFRNIALFLLGRMIYNDGLLAIFAFGGVYAAGIFGWELMTLGVFGIILTVFAALSCFVGGALDDRLGSKPTLVLSLIVLAIGIIGVVSVSSDAVLFVVPAPPLDPARPLFGSLQEMVYLVFGIVIGLAVGPTQAVSRTFMARLAPPALAAEYFGLYAFSGKATAFAAPVAVAVATATWQSQRAGLAAIAAFVVSGLLLLLPVREPRRGPNAGSGEAR